jgi:hypothetical protein
MLNAIGMCTKSLKTEKSPHIRSCFPHEQSVQGLVEMHLNVALKRED